MYSLYPLSEAQKCLHMMLPSAYSGNSLLADMVVFDYFRQAWDTGVTGVYRKPFYTEWKGRLKQRGVGLLQRRYDAFKEHRPSQAELIQW